MISCGGFHLSYPDAFPAANPTGTIWDLEICADLALTRGAVAYYLTEVLDVEGNGDRFMDDDGAVYEDAIEPELLADHVILFLHTG